MKIILAAMLSCAFGGVSATAQAQETAPISVATPVAETVSPPTTETAPAAETAPAIAIAASDVTPVDDASAPVTPPVDIALAEASPFDAAATVDAEQLGTVVGQADVNQYVTSNNTSTVSNNRVDGNSVTGTISFDSQSFQNMNGLTVLSANTGNNVAINAALNVNVSIHP